jgi:uncharacterized protein
MFHRLRTALAAWRKLTQSFTLMGAAMNGRPDIVRKVLGKGTDVNVKTKSGLTPLLAAIKHNGNAETVRVLLNGGADVTVKDENGQTALKIASKRGRVDIIELLKTAGAVS